MSIRIHLQLRYNFCGREVKNAVKDACVTAGRELITQSDLVKACDTVKTLKKYHTPLSNRKKNLTSPLT